MLKFAVTLLALCAANAQLLSRTAWQVNNGVKTIFPLGACSPQKHGDVCEFNQAVIPPEGDGSWTAAPKSDVVGWVAASSITACKKQVAYTYFQTRLTIPSGAAVNFFSLSFAGMDDGVRVTVFNSAYPKGTSGNYVFLGQEATSDMATAIIPGETLRIVLTLADDCPSRNDLSEVKILINNAVIPVGDSPVPTTNVNAPILPVLQSIPIPTTPRTDCVGDWSAWGDCSKSCMLGQQARTYRITTQALNGGAECPRAVGFIETQLCNPQPCPLSCVGAWTDWSACSQTCGSGASIRTYLVSVASANGGVACARTAGETESVACNTVPCPIDCVGQFGAWGACSVSCGGGSRTRAFAVTVPASLGGKSCSVTAGATESQGCNTAKCPVDCVGSWGAWGNCDKTCGQGTQTRTYYVTTPDNYGGAQCTNTNNFVATQSCNLVACPVNCAGDWGAWSACSQPCGPSGTRTRTFTVTVAALYSGTPCVAANGQPETQQCNTQPCPINCVGSWGAWGTCSKSCDTGSQSRTFVVTTPQQYGGNACIKSANEIETQTCGTAPCPINCVGSWGGWTGCSQACGGGSRSRTYTITTYPKNGGAQCSEKAGDQFDSCNVQECPRNCVGAWGAWSQCTEQICGVGNQRRLYQISEPARAGGSNCPFAHNTPEDQSCQKKPCPSWCNPACSGRSCSGSSNTNAGTCCSMTTWFGCFWTATCFDCNSPVPVRGVWYQADNQAEVQNVSAAKHSSPSPFLVGIGSGCLVVALVAIVAVRRARSTRFSELGDIPLNGIYSPDNSA